MVKLTRTTAARSSPFDVEINQNNTNISGCFAYFALYYYRDCTILISADLSSLIWKLHLVIIFGTTSSNFLRKVMNNNL